MVPFSLLRQVGSFQANIKLEAYGYAIADATRAVELDPSYVKVRDLDFSTVKKQRGEKESSPFLLTA